MLMLASQPVISDYVVYAAVGAGLVIAVVATVVVAKQYKRCPSNKILVIYGRVGQGRSHKCHHGGGGFVVPMVQDFSWLSLEPIVVDVPLEGAPTRDGIRLNVPSTFTIAISTDPLLMELAAERLLNVPVQVIREQALEIIVGQLRLTVAELTIKEIHENREKFMEMAHINVGEELHKLGLELINFSLRELSDESGHFVGMGRRAAADAVRAHLSLNPHKVSVDGARVRTKEGVTLDVAGWFSFAAAYSAAEGQTAAQQQLNLPEDEQKEGARAVFLEQVKLLAEQLTAAEIETDPERMTTLTRKLAGGEFHRRGLELMSVDVRVAGRRLS